jgi:hypothetical protein
VRDFRRVSRPPPPSLRSSVLQSAQGVALSAVALKSATLPAPISGLLLMGVGAFVTWKFPRTRLHAAVAGLVFAFGALAMLRSSGG